MKTMLSPSARGKAYMTAEDQKPDGKRKVWGAGRRGSELQIACYGLEGRQRPLTEKKSWIHHRVTEDTEQRDGSNNREIPIVRSMLRPSAVSQGINFCSQ
jgi:hypothetical protein